MCATQHIACLFLSLGLSQWFACDAVSVRKAYVSHPSITDQDLALQQRLTAKAKEQSEAGAQAIYAVVEEAREWMNATVTEWEAQSGVWVCCAACVLLCAVLCCAVRRADRSFPSAPIWCCSHPFQRRRRAQNQLQTPVHCVVSNFGCRVFVRHSASLQTSAFVA